MFFFALVTGEGRSLVGIIERLTLIGVAIGRSLELLSLSVFVISLCTEVSAFQRYSTSSSPTPSATSISWTLKMCHIRPKEKKRTMNFSIS